MREPVTLLVHQASVSVHVNLEQGACQAKRHSVMPFSGKSISSYFAYFRAHGHFHLDSIALSKLCNNTLAGHRVLVVAGHLQWEEISYGDHGVLQCQ